MNRPAILWVVLLLCVAFLAWRWSSCRAGEGEIHDAFEMAPGLGLGRQLALDFPDGGLVLLLADSAAGDIGLKQARAQARGIRSGYGSDRLEVRVVGAEEGGPVSPGRRLVSGFTVARAKAAVAQYPEAKAIIADLSAYGLPGADDVDGLPPLYAMDFAGQFNWEEPLAAGLVRAVVCLNPPENETAPPSRQAAPEDILARHFTLQAPPPSTPAAAPGPDPTP